MAVTFGAFTPETYQALLAQATPIEVVQPTLYVNSVTGSDANPGTSADQAVATIAQALGLAQNGTTIGIFGVFKEHCTTRLGLQDVTIVGLANTPRQATTSGVANGGGATWLNASGGTTALLTVQGQGITVRNIFFNNAATAAPCIDLVTVGDPPAQADAAHFLADRCIFTGTDNGIDATDGTNYVTISGCTFYNFAGTGDTAISAAQSIGTLLGWKLVGNVFLNNVNHVVAACSQATVTGNNFIIVGNSVTTTIALSLTGGAGNSVYANNFNRPLATSPNATLYVGGTNDTWGFNYGTDEFFWGVPDNS